MSTSKEKAKAYAAAYYQANKDYFKKYAEANKEKYKQYRAANKEATKARHDKHREAHRAEKQAVSAERKASRIAYEKQYREINKERRKIEKKAYNDANRDRIRERSRQRITGVSGEQFKQAVARQGGVCDICREPLRNFKPKMIHADHDHATGKFRGVLCADCNLGIGRFKDDVTLLHLAIMYLNRTR